MSDDVIKPEGEIVVGAMVDDGGVPQSDSEQPTADSRQPDSEAGDGRRATGDEDQLPADPEEAVAFLLNALHTAQDEATAYLGDLQRVAAEFENYRKRALRERDEIVSRATQAMIRDLLPVLDSFDGALQSASDSADVRLLAGIRSTHQLLMDVLGREGVEAIPAAGLPFDPTLHEAVSGGGTGHLVVTAEMRRGYTLRGRVVRPSLVTVAAEDVAGGDTG